MSDAISLDLAKRFKEAGIEFETKYVYHIHAPIDCECPSILMIKPEYNYSAFLIAPTAEEIRTRFPEELVLHIGNEEGEVVIDCTEQEGKPIYTVKGPTLAEALSEMYLYLYKNGLIGKQE